MFITSGSRFERYLEMLLERRMEGLIVLANWLSLDIDFLADLEKSSVPIAIIGCQVKTKSISSVKKLTTKWGAGRD